MAKRQYNADKNEWENQKAKDGPTPASNTRKKMKKKAAAAKAAEAAAPKSKKKKSEAPPIPKDKPKKAPIPKDRPKKSTTADDVANSPDIKKLKGKVPAKPGPHTKGGNTGDKTKGGANRVATYLKRKKQLGT
jgi:hypothetical protein